jgi:hypothetical protein
MNKHLQRGVIAAAVILAIAIIAPTSHRMERRKPVETAAAAEPISTPAAFPPNSLAANRRLALPEETTAEQKRNGEADPDLIAAKEALRAYRSRFGENPVGNNAEITRALTGANNEHAQFADPDRKIKQGQMVDRWDHFLFFHQLSGTEMEIRSAGADGVMWTKDDEVLR